MDPTRGDSRYNLNYSMNNIGISLSESGTDLYGNPSILSGSVRPPTLNLMQSRGCSSNSALIGQGNNSTVSGGEHCQTLVGGQSRGIKRNNSDCYEDNHCGTSQMTSQTLQELDACSNTGGQTQSSIQDNVEENYTSLQNKKSPPANGKKTKGRVKIKMEYIDNKLRRYTTFSKRKTGIMKKAYELSTLTGTQVMLLVASETGHVYTFATRKLQPMITSEAGKQLIQTCLNSPDPPTGTSASDQRMSATGFEETELSYNINDEDTKVRQLIYSHGHHGHAHLSHPQAISHYSIEQSLMQSSYSGGQHSPLSHVQSYAPSHGGHSHHAHIPHPHSTHMNHAHTQR